MRVRSRWVRRLLGMALLGGALVGGPLVGCAGTQFGAQTTESGWLRIETKHFLIHSAQGRIAAMDLARSLEEIRASLLKLGWGDTGDPKGRTEFVVFDRKSEFSKFTGSGQVDGIAISRIGKERLLSFYPDGSNGVPFVAVHELTHDLSRWFVPLQPLWYSEGVAGYYETLTFDRDTRTATVGGLNKLRVSQLKAFGFTLRVEKLFNASSSILTDPRESISVYAGTWLFMHFLKNEYADKFHEFRVNLASLMPWKDAWQRTFGSLKMDELNDELIQYAKRAEFSVFSAAIELPRFEPKVTPLSKTQAQGLLLRTAYRFGNEELYNKLLASAPPGTEKELYALTVAASQVAGKPESKSLTAELVRKFPNDGEAWLSRAEALGNSDEGLKALLQAEKLIPHHPGVRRMLVDQALRAGDAKAALGHAQVLIRRSPPMPEIYDRFIKAMAASGGCELIGSVVESIDLILGECGWIDDDTGERSTCNEYLSSVKQKACKESRVTSSL